MTRFAEYDPEAPSPQPVMGWYDTGILYYPNLPPLDHLVEATDEQWTGHFYNSYQVVNGELQEYTPPPYVPPPPTVLKTSDFLSRFTSQEQVAVATAALADASLLVILIKAAALQLVDLLDQHTTDSLEAFVVAGAVTEERKTQILTP